MKALRTGKFEQGEGPTEWYFTDIYVEPWKTTFRIGLNTEPRPKPLSERYPYGCWVYITHLVGYDLEEAVKRRVSHQNFRYPQPAVWEALNWVRILFRHDLMSVMTADPHLARHEIQELHRLAYGVPSPELRSHP